MSPEDKTVDDFRRSQLAAVGARYHDWANMSDHYQDEWRAKYRAAVRHLSLADTWEDGYWAGYDDATAPSSDAVTPNPHREAR